MRGEHPDIYRPIPGSNLRCTAHSRILDWQMVSDSLDAPLTPQDLPYPRLVMRDMQRRVLDLPGPSRLHWCLRCHHGHVPIRVWSPPAPALNIQFPCCLDPASVDWDEHRTFMLMGVPYDRNDIFPLL